MEQRNLWGDSFKATLIRTPYIILREQASMLGELTENLLEAVVERRRSLTNVLTCSLSILAPALDNYSYKVLDINYLVPKIYPVTVINLQTTHDETICENEEKFIETIGNILSSSQVHSVIVNLLSQIKAET